MSELPKRNNEIYLEIEQFENFELTNCIAYEMFKRVPKVQKLLPLVLSDPTDELLNELRKYGFDYEQYVMYEVYKMNYRHFGITGKPYVETRPAMGNISDKLPDNEFEQVVKIETEAWNQFNDPRLGIKSQNELKSICDSMEYLFTDESHNIFKENMTNQIEAHNRFSRPTLYFPEIKSVKIELNVSLPLEELQAYVKVVQESALKNASPREFLGIEFDKVNAKMLKNKKSKTQKIADWFFIYDCYKVLKKASNKSDEIIFGEIDLMLMEYYAVEEDFHYSTETYKKTILKKMKYFIEEQGYKGLLTNTSER